MSSKSKKGLKNLGQLGIYFNSGLTMAIALLFWLAVGYFLDSKFETAPRFLIAGVIFGMLSVFYELYKLIKISIDIEKKDQDKNGT